MGTPVLSPRAAEMGLEIEGEPKLLEELHRVGEIFDGAVNE